MSVAAEISIEVPGHEVSGPDDAPAFLALGGISATRHVCATPADPRPGWWEAIAGDGRVLDTSRYRVIGCDFLDGGRDASGRPLRSVSTHDQADAIAAMLDDLGVTRLRALIGASYGGMVALAFAARYPERLEQLIVISAAHRSDPMATARRIIQRRIVELGLDTGRTHEALVVARALAMTTYRSSREFAQRFDGAADGAAQSHAIESYLRHHGEKFAQRVPAERYLALSESTDLHAVDPRAIRAPTTLVAAEHDAIVPRAQLAALARAIGAHCRLVDLPSIHGHDAFLTEPEQLGSILHAAFTTSQPS
jgi:homoserine O-acetyltransferase/O-succinyltransferase